MRRKGVSMKEAVVTLIVAGGYEKGEKEWPVEKKINWSGQRLIGIELSK